MIRVLVEVAKSIRIVTGKRNSKQKKTRSFPGFLFGIAILIAVSSQVCYIIKGALFYA